MNKNLALGLLLWTLVLGLCAPAPLNACTTFCLSGPDTKIVAKSYDWEEGAGLVMVNKRGVRKVSLRASLWDKPAEWVSKHASLTFNQYGRELPNGGMNDGGLVVEIMWLDASRYPKRDQRMTVNELQWIQFMLDQFATVDEVAEHAQKIRVSPLTAKVHYLACDRSGECAVFEYLAGNLTIARGDDVRALTNHTYEASAAYRREYQGFGGNKKTPRTPGSLDRFVRASLAVKAAPSKNEVERAFAVLADVGQGDLSKWNIVYETDKLRVHFRSKDHPSQKYAELGAFDPSCRAPVLVLDLNNDYKGDTRSRFEPYAAATNKALIQKNVATLGRAVPNALVQIAAAYPDSLTCTEK